MGITYMVINHINISIYYIDIYISSYFNSFCCFCVNRDCGKQIYLGKQMIYLSFLYIFWLRN